MPSRHASSLLGAWSSIGGLEGAPESDLGLVLLTDGEIRRSSDYTAEEATYYVTMDRLGRTQPHNPKGKKEGSYGRG